MVRRLFIPPPNSDAVMKLSVLLTTYNHEPFIAQAINSVLMQRVSFDYEVVIGEDSSTDGTRDIVIEFSKKCPEKIRLALSEKNSGECRNIARTLAKCGGEYVAMLDGDDYWTHPDKLQRQVDFLDSHPEYAMCCHNARSFYEDGSQESYDFNPLNQKETSTLDDLWVGNFVATCSAMFRRGLVRQLPDWFCTFRWGDWPLYILCAEQGKIGYISEVMAAYRIHPGGAWSGLREVEQLEQVIEFYARINAHLSFRYDEIIRTMISKHRRQWARIDEENGDSDRAELVEDGAHCPSN